jgi:S-adenosylmethionine:tRNA ribosyltransferase-isomerase
MSELSLADFDYELPEAQIAQHPPKERDGGRLLLVDRRREARADPEEHAVSALGDLIPDDCLVVINDSRVIPARLAAKRASGGQVEIMLLERLASGNWRAMVRASKRLAEGETLVICDPDSGEATDHRARLVSTPAAGRCDVSLDDERSIASYGRMPLPPYIRRPVEQDDFERYQTVYAQHEGSVAAPTAGLHLTEAAFARLEQRGIEVARVTLHVGPGTFIPVRSDDPRQHVMEGERYEISPQTAAVIRKAKADGRRVLAVGTTTVRALEDSEGKPGEARAELFIFPGHRFSVVDALLTNFHLPKSTLLMLVSALAGRERILSAYRHAVALGFRFYSYGDAMLIL